MEYIVTGDLLLFSGKGPISSAIKLFTGHFLSHVGVAYRCPVTLRLYCWEMGNVERGSGPLITRYGKTKEMAHLVLLDKKLESYTGQVYVRGINKSVDGKKFSKFLSEHLGTSYNSNVITAWNERGKMSFIPLSFLDHTNREDANTLEWMCSQLVAVTYEHLGIMQLNRPSHSFMPFDFWTDLHETINGYRFMEPALLYDSKLTRKKTLHHF